MKVNLQSAPLYVFNTVGTYKEYKITKSYSSNTNLYEKTPNLAGNNEKNSLSKELCFPRSNSVWIGGLLLLTIYFLSSFSFLIKRTLKLIFLCVKCSFRMLQDDNTCCIWNFSRIPGL